MFQGKLRRGFAARLCNFSADVVPSAGLKLWGTTGRATQGFSAAWIIPQVHV